MSYSNVTFLCCFIGLVFVLLDKAISLRTFAFTGYKTEQFAGDLVSTLNDREKKKKKVRTDWAGRDSGVLV